MNDVEKAAWLAARCGKVTASRAKDICAKGRSGYLKCRSDYMRELLAERLTGLSVRHFVTDAMQWGLDHEDEAWEVYAARTGDLMRSSRFYDHPTIPMCGATPDRESVFDPERLGESKCPTTAKHIDWCLAGVVPEEYKPQLLLQCASAQKSRVTFISYDPRVRQERLQLFVQHWEPPRAEIEALEAEVQKFLDELDRAWSILVEA